MWKPSIALIGSFFFALFYTLPGVATSASGALKQFLEMIPYIMTIIILILTSIFKLKSAKAPDSLGTSYFREDR